MRRTGLAKATIYKLPGFPRPIRITATASAWIESEVTAWIQRTIQEQRTTQAS
jgi:predicted DNA-binding transcriptional regulator AlpA